MALINALIVVAALAAVSVALIARTDAARQRLELRQQADQATRYLDGAALLTQRLIENAPPETIHLRQAWALPRRGEAIDRGTVSWEITDLQGRFNVNWLMRTDAMGEAARIALPLLARAQDVPAAVAGRLQNALDPLNLFRDSAFGGSAGVSSPPDLPLAMPNALRLVTGAGEAQLDALMPYLAALPHNSALNINTTSPQVLAAFLPSLRPRDLALLQERLEEAPFQDIQDFLEWAELAFGEQSLLILEGLDLTTGSDWFEARLSARLDTVALQRSAVLHRREDTGRSEIVMSIPEVD
ncbi:MAG: type II secretion system minor pseudopilin GspK [Pararhodobacter sp.]|nr:type II secretion system minor pseudopilin GspK [Pararhodobacter sp.]